MKIAFFSYKSYDKEWFDPALENSGIEIDYFRVRLERETVHYAQGSDVICAFVNDDLSRPVIEGLAEMGIKMIALRCAGFNNVDLEAAEANGIPVYRVPEYSPHAVAEHAVALILALNRKIHKAYNRVRDGNFSLSRLAIHHYAGSETDSQVLGHTGPGLPGIPLAITEPGKRFVLLDSNSKKTRFMTQAVAELGLTNVRVMHSRIEAFTTDQVFTTIVSRAFATLSDFINGCMHLCSNETLLLAMKGKHPAGEIAELPMTWQIEQEVELHVPQVEGERRVLLLKQNN